MKRVALYGTVVALIHFAVATLHGYAHGELRIDTLNSGEKLFVHVVTLGPCLAALLLWTRLRRAGLVLLGGMMAGAFVFGIYHHFVLPSPDHAAQVPAGLWGNLFRLTAVVLAVIEGLSAAVGLRWLYTHDTTVPQVTRPAGIR